MAGAELRADREAFGARNWRVMTAEVQAQCVRKAAGSRPGTNPRIRAESGGRTPRCVLNCGNPSPPPTLTYCGVLFTLRRQGRHNGSSGFGSEGTTMLKRILLPLERCDDEADAVEFARVLALRRPLELLLLRVEEMPLLGPFAMGFALATRSCNLAGLKARLDHDPGIRATILLSDAVTSGAV